MDVKEQQPISTEPTQAPKNAAKVTARMIKIRELISTGDYPDRDELAERIVDKL